MRRSEILAELTSAKRAAVEQLLGGTETPRRQTSWVVRTHPEHNVVGIGVGRKIKRGRSTRTTMSVHFAVILGFQYWYYVSAFKDGSFTGPGGDVTGRIGGRARLV